MSVDVAAPSIVELRPQRGAPRLGVYDVLGDTLRIDYGEPGGSRPADLTRASVYRTR